MCIRSVTEREEDQKETKNGEIFLFAKKMFLRLFFQTLFLEQENQISYWDRSLPLVLGRFN